MQVTYAHKQALLTHFADAKHWKSVFSEEFFLSKKRKGIISSLNPATDCFVNDDKNWVEVRYASKAKGDQTKASMFFEIQEDKICVADESGNTLVILSGGVIQSNWAKITPAKYAGLSDQVVEVPNTGMRVYFNKDGEKTLFLGDRQVVFPKPDNRQAQIMEEGGMLHVADVTHEQAGLWGLPAEDLLNVIKLVVACDLAIEPGIKAFNTIDSWVFVRADNSPVPNTGVVHQLFPKMETTAERRSDLYGVQKVWNDTIEFTGYDVPVPDTFRVRMEKDGVSVRMSLEQREAIWAQGDIFQHVIEADVMPMQTASLKTTPGHFLNLLQNGRSAHDRRKHEWSYVVIETKDSLPISLSMRTAVRRAFGLTARHCAILTYDQNRCIIAMDARMIDAAKRMYDSNRERRVDEAAKPYMDTGHPLSFRPQSPHA